MVWLKLVVFFVFLYSIQGASFGKELGQFAIPRKYKTQWSGVQKKINEQKLQAALKQIENIQKETDVKASPYFWTRLFLARVRLQTGLHGYEKSVVLLRSSAWPEDKLAQAALWLYYAHSLQNYYNSYSWEISKREQIVSTKKLEVKKWTKEQIFNEIQSAMSKVWLAREEFGKMPKTAFSVFISPNTYPKGIRPTLRDQISYLWSDLLANSSFWRADHSNEVYQLNTDHLLGYSLKPFRKIKMKNEEIHPLLKMSRVLIDLERWHKKNRQLEAALEARMTRYKLLQRHLKTDKDKEKIRLKFETYLESMDRLPWKAMGFAQLARFYMSSSLADRFITAREFAKKGYRISKLSPGGQNCLSVIQSIESPSFDLQGQIIDGIKSKSFLLKFKNIRKVFFQAYQLNLEEYVTGTKDYNFYPDHRDIKKLIDSKTPDHSWSVSLKETKDYQNHQKFLIPPIKQKGFYIVLAGAKKNFKQTSKNMVKGIPFILSDLVLVRRKIPNGSWEILTQNGVNGAPIKGAKVSLMEYNWRKGHRRVDQKVSDPAGKVIFDKPSGSSNNYFLFAQKGEDLSTDNNTLSFYSNRRNTTVNKDLVYTDRSIYRPKQKIKFKIVSFSGNGDKGQYQTLSGAPVTVTLKDANYKKVTSLQLKTNEYGTASGEFEIPTGRVLGQWLVETNRTGRNYIRVEEYKRPTFEVTLENPKQAIRFNESAVVSGQVKYYFGLPVTTGKVKWKVHRRASYPYWWSWFGWSLPGGNQLVATGLSSLNEEGKFNVEFIPEADQRLKTNGSNVVYTYSVSADVTDEGGETRSDTKNYTIGFVDVKASIQLNSPFFISSDMPGAKIRRMNLNGEPLKGLGRYQLFRLTMPKKVVWPDQFERNLSPMEEDRKEFIIEDDLKFPKWTQKYYPQMWMKQWKNGRLVASGGLKHQRSGEGKVKWKGLKSGAYRLVYKTRDQYGSNYETSTEFLVSSKKSKIKLPFYFGAQKTSYKVGEVAKFLIVSGKKNQPIHYEITRGMKSIQSGTLFMGKDQQILQVPVTPSLRGGFHIKAWMLNGHKYYMNAASVMVPWDNFQFNVQWKTFRDRLRPGQKEKWALKVTTDDKKNLVKLYPQIELLAYMYDKSLDAFTSHNPVNPMSQLARFTGDYFWTGANLRSAPSIYMPYYSGISTVLSPTSFRSDHLRFFNGWAIGGLGRGGLGGMSSRVYKKGSNMAAAPMAMEESLAETEADELMDAPVGRKREMKAKVAKEKQNRNEPARDSKKDVSSQTPSATEPVRENFSETAFWKPHLKLNDKGESVLEFQVPDSLTSWNVSVIGVGKNFHSGQLFSKAETVKELMIRPAMPRFLREGDKAFLKVNVNNASKKPMTVNMAFSLTDGVTGKNLAKQFGLTPKQMKSKIRVKAKGSRVMTVPIQVPAGDRSIVISVQGQTKKFSDGEKRPLNILPGRFHLIQSRFAALKQNKERVLHFKEMKSEDKTRINEDLIVTVDAQMIQSVLKSIPYLVNYPYQCTEQTMNRFLSSSIIFKTFGQSPLLKNLAKQFSKRKTRFEKWNSEDPNRKMKLEETPWYQISQGGRDPGYDLVNLLHPSTVKSEKARSLRELKKAQTAIGGFPWYPGGPPSPYITLVIVYGFSKAAEFGVAVPKDLITSAWKYLHKHFKERNFKDHGVYFLTFLNYVATNFKDKSYLGGFFNPGEQSEILNWTFKFWKEVSPLTKAYMALTLNRLDRAKDAKLVFDSIMDSAKTTEDQGTFWTPEDRSWLWYNDRIESHAFVLRALTELSPDDSRKHGLVQWLFLNKKLNHWQSTKATAEVLYSLVHYMKSENMLGKPEQVIVQVGDKKKTFNFDPNVPKQKAAQWRFQGPTINEKKMHTIKAKKTDKAIGFVSATWHFSTEKLPPEADGDFLSVKRKFYLRVVQGGKVVLKPISEGQKITLGDEIEIHLSIRAKHSFEYVHLRDPRPAGFEPGVAVSQWKYNLGLAWYEEIRDSATNFFFEKLPHGEFNFKYRVKASMAGSFKVSPATLQSMYAPEFAAHSAGDRIRIQ